MMKGDHGPTKLLHDLTWGAFDHTSYALPSKGMELLHVILYNRYAYYYIIPAIVFSIVT